PTLSALPTLSRLLIFLLFFTDPSTTEIYTLSLHDALPISGTATCGSPAIRSTRWTWRSRAPARMSFPEPNTTGTRRCPSRSLSRSEEHTSELQSPYDLVCRLLLEKKKKKKKKKKT